jgi:hypothetical protein
VPALVSWSPILARQGVLDGRFGIGGLDHDHEFGAPAAGLRRKRRPRRWRTRSRCLRAGPRSLRW